MKEQRGTLTVTSEAGRVAEACSVSWLLHTRYCQGRQHCPLDSLKLPGSMCETGSGIFQ